MVEAADPNRSLAQLGDPVAGRDHHHRRTVAVGGAVVLAQRAHLVGFRQQLFDREVALAHRVRVVHRVAQRSRRHFGHLLLAHHPGFDTGARLNPGQAVEVGPQRSDTIGIELDRLDLADVTGRGLAEAVDQSGVDLAGLNLHPGFVERPCAVLLDVGLLDRRPRADGVERHDEGKGLPLQPIAAAGTGEIDLVARQARAFDRFGRHRLQNLDLAANLGGSVRLREGYDADVAHQQYSLISSKGTSGSSIGSKYSILWTDGLSCSSGSQCACTRIPIRTSSNSHFWRT